MQPLVSICDASRVILGVSCVIQRIYSDLAILLTPHTGPRGARLRISRRLLRQRLLVWAHWGAAWVGTIHFEQTLVFIRLLGFFSSSDLQAGFTVFSHLWAPGRRWN